MIRLARLYALQWLMRATWIAVLWLFGCGRAMALHDRNKLRGWQAEHSYRAWKAIRRTRPGRT